jgi:hypothetical protein
MTRGLNASLSQCEYRDRQLGAAVACRLFGKGLSFTKRCTTEIPRAGSRQSWRRSVSYMHQPDLGMVMANALHVQANESARGILTPSQALEREGLRCGRTISSAGANLVATKPYLSIAVRRFVSIRREPRMACSGVQAALPQHFLNFCPDPQGHGSLRPTLLEA